MKKTYQNPELTIVRVAPHRMISASEQLGFGLSVESAADAEVRQLGNQNSNFSVWDDDWSE